MNSLFSSGMSTIYNQPRKKRCFTVFCVKSWDFIKCDLVLLTMKIVGEVKANLVSLEQSEDPQEQVFRLHPRCVINRRQVLAKNRALVKFFFLSFIHTFNITHFQS